MVASNPSSSCPPFPTEGSLYRTTSPFVDAPVSRSVEETEELFFASAEISSAYVVDIVAENTVSPSLIEEITAFVDSNANGFLDPGEQVLYTYVVKVFLSRDDSYLKTAFEATTPKENEACFFFEDNSTDFLSDRSAYIKIGEGIRKNFTILEQMTAQTSNAFHYLKGVTDGQGATYEIDFTASEIQELIATGEISNPERETWIMVFQAVNVQSMVFGPVYGAVGDGILFATKTLREYIKFSEKHWDPEQGNFSPLLSAFALEGVAAYESLSEETIQAIARAMTAVLEAKRQEFLSLSQEIMKSGYMSALSEDMIAFLEDAFAQAEEFLQALMAQVEAMIRSLAALGSSAINAINAFLCGLWNGLVEAVLGIVDLVGYIFSALGAIGEAVSDAQRVIPEALEVIDEAIQALQEADLRGMFSEAMAAISEGISTFNLYALTGEITIEKVAYFLGGVAGFIVEIVVGLLWSGGIDGLRAVITKFGKIGTDILEFILKGAQRAVGAAMSFSVQSILAIIRKILALLRAGKEQVRVAIQAIFDALEAAAKLADDVVAAIVRSLKLTPGEEGLLEEIGLTFVKYTDDAASACLVRS